MLEPARRTEPAKHTSAGRPGAPARPRTELVAGTRLFGFATARKSASAASPNRIQLTAGGLPTPWVCRLAISTTAAPIRASAPATSASIQRERVTTAIRRPARPPGRDLERTPVTVARRPAARAFAQAGAREDAGPGAGA